MRNLLLTLFASLAFTTPLYAEKPPEVTTLSTPSSIALAEHLTENGVVKYSAYWCPHCHEQNELFGKEASSKLLNVECAADGFNSKTSLCREKGIQGFPSWEINGVIESGIKSLVELAEQTNYQGLNDF